MPRCTWSGAIGGSRCCMLRGGRAAMDPGIMWNLWCVLFMQRCLVVGFLDRCTCGSNREGKGTGRKRRK
jgi:hypothetical protein